MDDRVPIPGGELERARLAALSILLDTADRLARVPASRLDQVLMHLAGGLMELERCGALVLPPQHTTDLERG